MKKNFSQTSATRRIAIPEADIPAVVELLAWVKQAGEREVGGTVAMAVRLGELIDRKGPGLATDMAQIVGGHKPPGAFFTMQVVEAARELGWLNEARYIDRYGELMARVQAQLQAAENRAVRRSETRLPAGANRVHPRGVRWLALEKDLQPLLEAELKRLRRDAAQERGPSLNIAVRTLLDDLNQFVVETLVQEMLRPDSGVSPAEMEAVMDGLLQHGRKFKDEWRPFVAQAWVPLVEQAIQRPPEPAPPSEHDDPSKRPLTEGEKDLLRDLWLVVQSEGVGVETYVCRQAGLGEDLAAISEILDMTLGAGAQHRLMMTPGAMETYAQMARAWMRVARRVVTRMRGPRYDYDVRWGGVVESRWGVLRKERSTEQLPRAIY